MFHSTSKNNDYDYKKKQDNLNVNKNRITAYNHILPDNNPAQRLVAEEEEQRQKEAAQLKESRKLSGEAIQEKVETYIVESGMSLGDIAAKFNVTIDELKTTNANKLKRWGKVQGFNAGEQITIPANKILTTEELIKNSFDDYKAGKISMPDLARQLLPYIATYSRQISDVFDSLPLTSRDNLAYAFAVNSDESGLSAFPKELLMKMSFELGGILNTTSWDENREQKARIDKALGIYSHKEINKEESVKGRTDSDIAKQVMEYMKKDRLTPEEIAKVRSLIEKLPDAKRPTHYLRLQSKVHYENQRDSQAKDNDKRIETKDGGMCTLASLAMAMQYLGISNPYPDMQFEDALEKVRQDNNYKARCNAGWNDIAEHLGVKIKFLLVDDSSPKNKEWWISNVLAELESGKSVIMSIHGHVVRVQSINNSGVIVDDPYGKLNLEKRKENNGRGGYDSYNKSEWNFSKEGDGKVGEDNVWSWTSIEKYNMNWIVSFNK